VWIQCPLPPTFGFWYGGYVNMARQWNPESELQIWEQTGDSSPSLCDFYKFPKTDPAKNYRLVFSGVGPELAIQLFDLTDGALVAMINVVDDTLTDGWVGFYVGVQGPSGTVDFWLDNFVAVGTTP